MSPAAYPRRKSLRLPEFDYSTPGGYFVTICVRHRICLLEPSPVREMIQKWWDELPHKYPNVETSEFVVMPNHIHGIIILNGPDVLCVGPVDPHPAGGHIGPPLPLQNPTTPDVRANLRVAPLSTIIQWFKTMTTNSYLRGVKEEIWPPFEGKFWQRNYYEHIIRNEHEFDAISRYIRDNPVNWALDHDNPSNLSTSPAEMNVDYLKEIGT